MKLLLALVICTFMAVEGLPSADYSAYKVGTVSNLPSITGGRVAQKGRWPWYLTMERLHSSGWVHHCGAVLIGEKKAITAGHCIFGWDKPEYYRYKSGLSDRSGDGNHEQIIGVAKHTIHPDYKCCRRDYPNDIATAQLKEAVKTNQYVKFGTLPNADEDFVGKECWITGFGLTNGTKVVMPKKLYEAKMAALTTTDCNDKMPHQWKHVTDKMLGVFGDGERGSCFGDCGGPLQCKVNDVWKVAGLRSHNVATRESSCLPEYPSVYTRLSAYLDFIRQN